MTACRSAFLSGKLLKMPFRALFLTAYVVSILCRVIWKARYAPNTASHTNALSMLLYLVTRLRNLLRAASTTNGGLMGSLAP